ncbi:MAG: MBL fold metallo-hydrolase [Anaerolineae bacterium]|nr:MBL fold metallo-hydrolase [Anaerolineae bacterium]
MRLIFLGCSDSKGVPRVGCECDVCRNVLSPGSRNYRTGPSAALCYGPPYAQRTVLIDTAPEFRLQATGLSLRQFDALLVTHAHDDHILGFSTLVNAQRLAERQLPIYAPDHVLEEVRRRFEYIWTDKIYRKVIQPQAIDAPIDLWGLEVRPLRVDHGLGGAAYGYLLAFGGRRLAYVSDMLRPTAETRAALTGLDLLVLGASHYYEGIEMWRRSVMDITTALELIGEVMPARAILTHLSHTIEYDQISAKLPPNVSLAYDGLTVEVPE